MKTENTSIRLKKIMAARNLKQIDILNLAKPYCREYNIKLNKNDLSQYVSGKVEPGQNKLSILGMALNVSEAWLMGYDVPMEREYSYPDDEKENIMNGFDNILPLPKMRKIPLLGTIACGEPILAQENIEGDVPIPENIVADFALRCQGDSMIDARILDGDVVYIRQQPTVNNGEIAAVLIGDEATLKKVYLSGDTLTLLACNSSYEPFVYSGEQLNEIKILGKAVGFTSKI